MRRVLKWLAASALAVVLALALANAFDEELRPEVKAALAPVRDTVPAQDNLLHAFIGFDAPSDDFAQVGLARRQDMDRRIAAKSESLDWPEATGPDAVVMRGDTTLVNYADERFASVLATARQRPADTQALLAANTRLRERYQSLRRYPHFVDSLQLHLKITFPPYQRAAAGRKVWRLWLADAVRRGQRDLAVQELRDDILAWRRLTAQPQLLLIDKMILVAWLRTDFEAAAALLSDPGLPQPQRAALAEAASDLTPAERSLAGVLNMEFRFMATVLRDVHATDALFDQAEQADGMRRALRRVAGLAGTHLFKINATLNRQHRIVREAIEMDGHDCRQYRADVQAVQAAEAFPDWWTLAYNPVGKVLAVVGRNDLYRSYTGRMCDLVGFQRLLALQIRLHGQGITPQTSQPDVEAAITQAGAAYSDPFTGGPMLWSAARRAIAFGAVDDRNRKMLPWPL